jgi:hypothetical protein
VTILRKGGEMAILRERRCEVTGEMGIVMEGKDVRSKGKMAS